MTSQEIENAFSYHAPKEISNKLSQMERYETIRKLGKSLAHYINDNCPDSPDKEESIKCLREAIMWANASIACNE